MWGQREPILHTIAAGFADRGQSGGAARNPRRHVYCGGVFPSLCRFDAADAIAAFRCGKSLAAYNIFAPYLKAEGANLLNLPKLLVGFVSTQHVENLNAFGRSML